MKTVSEPAASSQRDTRRQAFEANKLAKKLHRQVGQAIVDYRMIGATGRLYLSGEESNVRMGAAAAERALSAQAA